MKVKVESVVHDHVQVHVRVQVESVGLLTTFPIVDSTRPAPAPVIFPQIADGGGVETQFIFIGTGTSVVSITLRFLGDDGLPIDVGRPAP